MYYDGQVYYESDVMYFLFTTNTPPQPFSSSFTGIMWFLMMPVIGRLIGYLNILQVNKFQKVSFVYRFFKEFVQKLYTAGLLHSRTAMCRISVQIMHMMKYQTKRLSENYWPLQPNRWKREKTWIEQCQTLRKIRPFILIFDQRSRITRQVMFRFCEKTTNCFENIPF